MNVDKPYAYKVTTLDSEGNEIVAYTTPAEKHRYVRSMNEEYGNAIAVPVSLEEMPEGLSFADTEDSKQ